MKVTTNEAGVTVVEYDGSNIRFAQNDQPMPTFGRHNRATGGLDTHRYPTFQELGGDGSRFAQNASLSEADVRYLEQESIRAVTLMLRGRQFCPPVAVPGSTRKYTYNRKAHAGGATIVGPGDTFPTDGASNTAVDVLLQKIGLADIISREQGLTTNILQDAIWTLMRQVAEFENGMTFNSLTLPDVDGLIDDAGNTEAAIAAWSGAVGTKKPLTDVQDAYADLLADGFSGPFLIGLEAVNYGEGLHMLNNAGDNGIAGMLAQPWITDVVVDPSIPHGTGIMVQVDPSIACTLVAEDLTIIVGPLDTMTQTIPVTCHEIVAPAIKQPNGVCSLTGL